LAEHAAASAANAVAGGLATGLAVSFFLFSSSQRLLEASFRENFDWLVHTLATNLAGCLNAVFFADFKKPCRRLLVVRTTFTVCLSGCFATTFSESE
jgi:hypothetical protein